MYQVLKIVDHKAKVFKRTKSMARAYTIRKELLDQGFRAYVIEKEVK